MRPVRLELRNFGRHRHLDLVFPDGCTALVGANGAGKSTLVNAIDLALFADGARDLAPWLTTGEPDMLILFEFDHNGDRYRLRRTYTAAGRGRTTLDLERYLAAPEHSGDDRGPGWEALTRETAAATQQAVHATLQFSRAAFRASAFSGQGDQAAFPTAKPADRKTILAEILTLDWWNRLLDRTRALLGDAQQEAATLHGTVAAHEQTVQRKPDTLRRAGELERAETEAADETAEADRLLEQATVERARADAAVERHRAARAAVVRAEDDLARARGLLDQARASAEVVEAKRVELVQAQAVAAAIPDLEQELAEALAETEARAEAERLYREREQLLAEATTLGERAAAARHLAAEALDHVGETHCQLCQQVLGQEAATVYADNQRAQADAWTEDARVLADRARALPLAEAEQRLLALAGARPEPDIHTDLRQARAAAETAAALHQIVLAHEQRATEIPEHRAALDQARAALDAAETEQQTARTLLPDLETLDRKLEARRHRQAEARAAHRTILDERARTIADLDQIRRAEAELTTSRERLTVLADRERRLHLAEKAYGRDGIPALILENVAIPRIEQEANLLLERLPTRDGRVYRVELRTQRELKTRDGLADVLDIVVVDELGARTFETFSGGEQARIAMGLRLGLSRLAAGRAGAEMRLLVLDEPAGLEEDAMLQLAGLLRELEAELGCVLVISHHPVLREAFDQRVELVSDAGVSRVVDEAAVEAVAA